MNFLMVFAFLFSIFRTGMKCSTHAQLVETPLGSLRGSIIKSSGGRDILSFRGVRYATAPVGSLRFKAPVPVKKWEGVINATQDGSDCGYIEDCLFLNVYINQEPIQLPEEFPPATPRASATRPRAVLVWFHGGAWLKNSGSSSKRGPQYLMNQDIVLVTCNYRLGALGFLSTGDDVLRGNYGMKDQVAVLRWVKQNIASFGGNPNNVTIGGNSAGAASVMFHLLSPMSKGLFHRAIAMSPAITPEWSVERNPKKQAKRQAKLLNCPTNSSKSIASCLRKKSAKEIKKSFPGMTDWNVGAVLIYKPVIEVTFHVSGVERFLTGEPMELLTSGYFHQVPYVTGVTNVEYAHEANRILKNKSLTQDLNDNWEKIAPVVFRYQQYGTKKASIISKGLKEFYLKNKPITIDSKVGLGQLYADAFITFGTLHVAKLISLHSYQPVHFYVSSYKAEVPHSDDKNYLFYMDNQNPLLTPEDEEYQIMVMYTTMWSNFVQTGEPSYKSNKWLPMLPNETLRCLDIGSDKLAMKSGLFEERMAVWENLTSF